MKFRNCLLLPAIFFLSSCASYEPINVANYNRNNLIAGEGAFCSSGECDLPPILIEGSVPVRPHYEELRHGHNGASVIFDVDDKGNILNPEIESSSSEKAAALALEAIRTFKFKPGSLNGKPVTVMKMRQVFVFGQR